MTGDFTAKMLNQGALLSFACGKWTWGRPTFLLAVENGLWGNDLIACQALAMA